MKRKHIATIILASFVLMLVLFAKTDTPINAATKTTKSKLNWKITDDEIFLPIHTEHINNHQTNGITITEYVNVQNRTVWVHLSEFQCGYGSSFTQEFDADGKPTIYDGDISQLRN